MFFSVFYSFDVKNKIKKIMLIYFHACMISNKHLKLVYF